MTSRRKYLPKQGILQVDESKIVKYLLNDNHPEGKSKAKFFNGHGLKRDAWKSLQAALVAHGESRPIISTEASSHGVKYVLECAVETPDGRNACIRTVWVTEISGIFRLVTAYPNAS